MIPGFHCMRIQKATSLSARGHFPTARDALSQHVSHTRFCDSSFTSTQENTGRYVLRCVYAATLRPHEKHLTRTCIHERTVHAKACVFRCTCAPNPDEKGRKRQQKNIRRVCGCALSRGGGHQVHVVHRNVIHRLQRNHFPFPRGVCRTRALRWLEGVWVAKHKSAIMDVLPSPAAVHTAACSAQRNMMRENEGRCY